MCEWEVRMLSTNGIGVCVSSLCVFTCTCSPPLRSLYPLPQLRQELACCLLLRCVPLMAPCLMCDSPLSKRCRLCWETSVSLSLDWRRTPSTASPNQWTSSSTMEQGSTMFFPTQVSFLQQCSVWCTLFVMCKVLL